MRSRTLINIVLLVLIVLLGSYVYITSQQETESTASILLTQLPADDVTQILIQHNQRQLELSKTNNRWHMLQPINIEANNFRIDTLLKLLKTVSHAAYPVAELELSKYGLSKSDTSISFNDITIEFGITNPVNSYRYIRIGDTVHLVDDHYYPLLSSQTGTLVARELIAGDAVIEKLVLPELTLYKDENSLWQSSGNTEPDAISETLHHWKNSQAFGVHNYMPRESLGDISVYLAGETEPVRFHVTDMDPWLIIARPDLDIEYHFNLEFYDRLLHPGTANEAAEQLSE
jgi:hypothetical protein